MRNDTKEQGDNSGWIEIFSFPFSLFVKGKCIITSLLVCRRIGWNSTKFLTLSKIRTSSHNDGIQNLEIVAFRDHLNSWDEYTFAFHASGRNP